jgi:hypothetical protein
MLPIVGAMGDCRSTLGVRKQQAESKICFSDSLIFARNSQAN